MQVKGMFRHSIKLYQAMLGIALKGFDTVDMLHTSNKLIVAAMHSEKCFAKPM